VQAQDLERVLSTEKALFIGAHPDDIEFYCGGLVVLMRERGAEVVFAVATRGGRGRRGKAKERLESLRGQHQLEAARGLGVDRVALYDYPDKHLASFVEPLARDLAALIARENPELVLFWDPEFIYNPHPDHQAAARAARLAADGRTVCCYGTRRPNLWVGLPDDALGRKLRSIRAHRTETPWYYWPLARWLVLRRSAHAGAAIGATYAEAYRALGGSGLVD